jgi:AcrR family transcriptional regulator
LFRLTRCGRRRHDRRDPAGPPAAGRRPAQPDGPARRRRGGLRRLRRRRAGARHRGVGTVYRHFPTRADLVVAVYRHQVEACAEAGATCLAEAATPYAALVGWIDRFVDLLVTKHGLATALRDGERFDALHAYFLDRLLPVFARLLDAAAASGEIRADLEAYEVLRGVGNLCIGADSDPRYDARRVVALLVSGLRRPA